MRRAAWVLVCAALSVCGCASGTQGPDAAVRGAEPAPAPSASAAPAGGRRAPPSSGRCRKLCDVITSCAAKAGHDDLAGILCSIARCETGDKCRGRITSRNGLYRGAFQFASGTWRSQCGPVFRKKGLAAQCAPERSAHDPCCAAVCASELIAAGGIGNWPTCGRKAR